MSEAIQDKLKQTYNDIQLNNNCSCSWSCNAIDNNNEEILVEYNNNAYTNSYNAGVIERYISQIEELKKENELLQQTNSELQEQIELTSSKILQETSAMQAITDVLGLSNQFQIKRAIQTLIDNTNTTLNSAEQIIKDEFVVKLKQLYLELVGSDESNNITYTKLEVMVHTVVDIVNDLMKQRKTNEINVNLNHNNGMRVLYRNFCRNIMKQNNIHNINEFETFISSIVNKREVNIS